MVNNRGAYMDLVVRPEGKRPLISPRRRWEDNIKMDLREVGWKAWTGSIWLRREIGGGACDCGNKPSGSTKCGEFVD
jgi:hypothetical protein